MAGAINGLMAKAYYNTTTVTNATWTEMTIIGDVQMPAARANSPVKERGSSYEKTLPGQIALEATFTMTRKTGNSQYDAIRSAFLSGNTIAFAFMTGAVNTNGSEGWQFDAVITDFPIGEPVDDASTIEVTVKPDLRSSVEPAYVIVGS